MSSDEAISCFQIKLCSSYALKDVDGVDNQQDLGMKL